MSDYDFKKMFNLDTVLREEKLPSEMLMDEVLITGLPNNFPARQLSTLVSQECSERGLHLPAMAGEFATDEEDCGAVLLWLQRPVNREIMVQSLMTCIEAIMDDMKIDILQQAYTIEPELNNNFDAAVTHIRNRYPGPHPNV